MVTHGADCYSSGEGLTKESQEVNSQGNVNMYVVLKVCIIYFVGDWSNGMIGVSKTFGGSSILSSPAPNESES